MTSYGKLLLKGDALQLALSDLALSAIKTVLTATSNTVLELTIYLPED